MPRYSIWSLAKQTFNAWSEDRASRLAAALAYYSIFCIAPLLLIAITIVGMVYGTHHATRQLHAELSHFLPAATVKPIESMVHKARASLGSGVWQFCVGAALLLYASSNLFSTLQDGLNTVWHVEPKPGRGIKGFIEDRGLTILLVAAVAVVLLASVVVEPILTGFGDRLTHLSPVVLQVINNAVCVVVFTLVFAAVFKVLPDAEVAIKDTLIGAFFTAVAFAVARYLLGFVIASSSTKSVYGATGSLVVLLLFIYYSAQLMLFGAEFTKVFAQRDGSPIEPSENARLIKVNSPVRGRERHYPPDQQGRGDAATVPADASDTRAGHAPSSGGAPAAGVQSRPDLAAYPPDRYNLPHLHDKPPAVKRRRLALVSSVVALAPLALLARKLRRQ